MKEIIYGKNPTEKITSIEIVDNMAVLYFLDGSSQSVTNYYWALADKNIDRRFKPLIGTQNYKWMRLFVNRKDYSTSIQTWKKDNDVYNVWDEKEAFMTLQGYTTMKGIKLDQIPILSMDIETNGTELDTDSKIFTISNTFRKGDGSITRKMFRVDKYPSEREMLLDWCKWVQEIDPTVIVGHNIFAFDLPYINHVARKCKIKLSLGKDGSNITVPSKNSLFRVDGNTTWDYPRIKIHGRHIIDTMFLSVKYDVKLEFPSWKLKDIIEHLGFIKEGRQFYDAANIKRDWYDLEKRELIVKYAEDDADDALALFDHCVVPFFYLCQYLPKTFQQICYSAPGAWLNSMLVRAYLQNGESVAKTSPAEPVSGGISYGTPGIYKNILKVDVSGLYPSVIVQYLVHPVKKDEHQYYYHLTEHFLKERLINKKLYKETGDKFYDGLQACQKVVANSLYGLLSTEGLNYNDFGAANFITGIGRQVIKKSIEWATSQPVENWWDDYDRKFGQVDKQYAGLLDVNKTYAEIYKDFVL